jgi:Ca2+-binding RTX toxin-like protein
MKSNLIKKSKFLATGIFRLRFALALGLGLGNAAWAGGSIQSVDVSPNPFATGQNFTIAVTASPEVTEGTATVDFRPGLPRFFELPLTKQGAIWTAMGVVPSDLAHQLPSAAGAMVKITMFDANKRRSVQNVHLGVSIVPIPTNSAVFANGILTITGDDNDNTLIASRDLTGNILVNNGTIPITGGVPTITNTTLIRILGLGGNDTLTIDDLNGQMPPAHLLGGDGDDILTGSASDDVLDGGPGNDTLFGRDGNDVLIGGPGNDKLIGGRGTDQLLGGDGDDQFVWNPGDGSDVVEGGGGQDTLLFNGANIAEKVDLSANGTRLRFSRDVASIVMDCAGVERVIFNALGGADQVTVNDLTGTGVTDVQLNLSGSSGGGDGSADTIIINGASGDDHVFVSQSTNGVQVAGLAATVMIAGGESNLDVLSINAQGGNNTVDFFGDATNEVVTLSPKAQSLRFVTSAGAMPVDCAGVEQVSFHALGGQDQITVDDLTGTSVTNVVIDLSTNTPAVGDGVAQTVAVNGTDGPDHLVLSGTGAGVEVLGLSAAIQIIAGEPGLDRLIVNANGGADIIDASAVKAGSIELTLNGGAGDDLLIGGEGNDVLIGGQGQDTEFGGPGDDIFVWNPGDGSDVMEGDAGQDTMLFNGANIAETVDISPNGQRVRFFRNVANITMDCNGVESIRFNALGGADVITVNDLTGTAVTNVDLNLSGALNTNITDNAADSVIIYATQGNDVVAISGSPADGVRVVGLAATVNITGSDPTMDQLRVNLLDGDDALQATDLQAGVINLTVDGGPGNDVLVGSAGDDVLLGGDGDDILEGGPGLDVLDGGPGNNVIIQD